MSQPSEQPQTNSRRQPWGENHGKGARKSRTWLRQQWRDAGSTMDFHEWLKLTVSSGMAAKGPETVGFTDGGSSAQGCDWWQHDVDWQQMSYIAEASSGDTQIGPVWLGVPGEEMQSGDTQTDGGFADFQAEAGSLEGVAPVAMIHHDVTVESEPASSSHDIHQTITVDEPSGVIIGATAKKKAKTSVVPDYIRNQPGWVAPWRRTMPVPRKFVSNTRFHPRPQIPEVQQHTADDDDDAAEDSLDGETIPEDPDENLTILDQILNQGLGVLDNSNQYHVVTSDPQMPEESNASSVDTDTLQVFISQTCIDC